MSITTYSELQTAVANWINRNDVAERIPEFITLAEARMKRDTRLVEISVLDFNAVEDYALPLQFKAVKNLYHDGASQYGRIRMVSVDELAERKLRHGDTGVPRWASVIETSIGRKLRFAPEPDGTYGLRLLFETELDVLSTANTSNWLLAAAPDIYLWGSLSCAEGFLQEDERIGLWKSEYDQAADEYKADKKRREYGGALTPRPAHIIGEDV